MLLHGWRFDFLLKEAGFCVRLRLRIFISIVLVSLFSDLPNGLTSDRIGEYEKKTWERERETFGQIKEVFEKWSSSSSPRILIEKWSIFYRYYYAFVPVAADQIITAEDRHMNLEAREARVRRGFLCGFPPSPPSPPPSTFPEGENRSVTLERFECAVIYSPSLFRNVLDGNRSIVPSQTRTRLISRKPVCSSRGCLSRFASFLCFVRKFKSRNLSFLLHSRRLLWIEQDRVFVRCFAMKRKWYF